MYFKVDPNFLQWKPNGQERPISSGNSPQFATSNEGDSAGGWAKGTNQPKVKPILTETRHASWMWKNGGPTNLIGGFFNPFFGN
jgi:hypothetical protein